MNTSFCFPCSGTDEVRKRKTPLNQGAYDGGRLKGNSQYWEGIGKRDGVAVFGTDYDTPDGTGVRDYIHVMDLAEGHLAALRYLQQHPGLLTVNLGTGRPVSVLEMVRAFEAASGRPVPYRVAPRRAGDIATCYADPTKAERELGWKARRGLDEMMRDAWRWQSMNPDGFGPGPI